MGKKFVIDTNILIDDPKCITKLGLENEIHILPEVLEEIDNNKVRHGLVGFNCRDFVKNLMKELDCYDVKYEGINALALDSNGVVKIVFPITALYDFGKGGIDRFDKDKVDNVIIKYAKKINGIVISNDRMVQLKAKILGVDAQEYRNIPKKNLNQLRDGVQTIKVNRTVINYFYANDSIELNSLNLWNDKKTEDYEFIENSFVILEDEISEKNRAIGIVKGSNLTKLQNAKRNPSGIKPRNLEQKMAIELLLDESIDIVTLTGKAGSSKTLLGLACALEIQEQSKNDKKKKKILLVKPPISLNKDHETGFKPGDLNEKYISVMGSITTNLSVICDDSDLTGKDLLLSYIEQGLVDIVSLEDILGSSFSNSIILFDEAQLLDCDDMLAVVSRVGDNSKMIITGDLKQHASNRLIPEETGLFKLVDVLTNIDFSGHLTLKTIQRSRLAELLAEKW